jgi:flavin reductase (DIM6/NTAB) family NADH-FMN oxidoreductase RutF
MRTDFDPDLLSTGRFYRLLTDVVVPRPIAWVSSTSASGVDNLAPHSFFTVASVSPPIVQFTSVGAKDTLRNVSETGEFVVNLAPEPLFEQINATATDFPAEVCEFDECGIAREPSLRVRPPRVAASPVALECRLHAVTPIGDCFVILGRVVHAAINTDMLDGEHVDVRRLRPLSRLGLDEWATVGPIREIARIKHRDWPPPDWPPAERQSAERQSAERQSAERQSAERQSTNGQSTGGQSTDGRPAHRPAAGHGAGG